MSFLGNGFKVVVQGNDTIENKGRKKEYHFFSKPMFAQGTHRSDPSQKGEIFANKTDQFLSDIHVNTLFQAMNELTEKVLPPKVTYDQEAKEFTVKDDGVSKRLTKLFQNSTDTNFKEVMNPIMDELKKAKDVSKNGKEQAKEFITKALAAYLGSESDDKFVDKISELSDHFVNKLEPKEANWFMRNIVNPLKHFFCRLFGKDEANLEAVKYVAARHELEGWAKKAHIQESLDNTINSSMQGHYMSLEGSIEGLLKDKKESEQKVGILTSLIEKVESIAKLSGQRSSLLESNKETSDNKLKVKDGCQEQYDELSLGIKTDIKELKAMNEDNDYIFDDDIFKEFENDNELVSDNLIVNLNLKLKSLTQLKDTLATSIDVKQELLKETPNSIADFESKISAIAKQVSTLNTSLDMRNYLSEILPSGIDETLCRELESTVKANSAYGVRGVDGSNINAADNQVKYVKNLDGFKLKFKEATDGIKLNHENASTASIN